MVSDAVNFPCFICTLSQHVLSNHKGIQLQRDRLNVRRYSVPTVRKKRTCGLVMNVSGDVSTSTSSERLLWAEGLTKSHDGKRILFQDISLTLARGQKVGLLGSNGSGKSTLLHILAGNTTPDEGQVTVKKGVRIACVAQDLPPGLDTEGRTVLDAVSKLANDFTSSKPVEAAFEYTKALDSGDDVRISKALIRMNDMSGSWDVATMIERTLTRLELPLTAQLSNLSGGQKRRVAIAAALVAQPEVLLLDEVTNHLSVEAIVFLEDMLRDPSLTCLVISHDRAFLDAVCSTALWDIDDASLVPYDGKKGYSGYLEAKAARVDAQRKQISTITSTYKRELEWIRRQPKARGTKSRARIEEFERLSENLRQRKRALMEKSRKVRSLSTVSTRLGTEVVRFENATLRRGDSLILDKFNYTLEPGERLGIVGQNGSGKSSLLKALMGKLPLEEGRVVMGSTVVVGYYDQNGIDVGSQISEATAAVLSGRSRGKSSESRVIDFAEELVSLFGSPQSTGTNAGDAEARLNAQLRDLNYSTAFSKQNGRGSASKSPFANMTAISLLTHFGFAPAQAHSFCSQLSGGEKRRLQLMALLLRNPNCLLLDEPSNDLDVATLSLLEDSLESYRGTIVIVSHDRYMLDRLVDHLIVLEGGGSYKLIEGRFSEYLEAKKLREAELRRTASKQQREIHEKKKENAPPEKRRMSYKEKREYGSIEGEIESLQQRLEEVNAKLNAEAQTAGYTQLAEWTAEMAELEASIETKTERWIELAEIAGDG